MATKHSKKKKICAFCNVNPGITREHVVPRCFFPEKLPPSTQLIVVPACLDCNNGISNDEEYVRSVITSKFDCGFHPSLNRTSALRSLQNNERLQREIFDNMQIVPILTHEGVVLAQWPSLMPDWERVERVICKIIKGLFYFEFKQPLSNQDGIFIFHNMSLSETQLFLENEDIASNTSHCTLANGEFCYSFGRVDGQSVAYSGPETYWHLSFYNGFRALAVTYPPSFDAKQRWRGVYDMFRRKRSSPT